MKKRQTANRMIVFLLLCVFNLSVFVNTTNLLILGFGSNRSRNAKNFDPPPFSLEMLEFVFNQAKFQPADVKLTTIPDNCTADFYWQDNSLTLLGKSSENFVLHVGPLCDYADNEVASDEFSGYFREVINLKTKSHHFFVTPILPIHIHEEKLTKPIYSKNSVVNHSPKTRPLFIQLNSDIDHFAKVIYKFASENLSPYTAFLSPVKEYHGHTDKFCRHLTDRMIRRSGWSAEHFMVRFRYFGYKTELEWLDIWYHVLQRARYIVYCGDEDLFIQWMEAGKKLWDPFKIEDFAIFFVTVNFYSSRFKFDQSTSELLSEVLSNVTTIQNVKILNFHSSVNCENMSSFCQKFITEAPKLIAYPKTDSNLTEILFKNEMLFYTLTLYQLFSKMSENVVYFWNHTNSESQFNTMFNLHEEVLVEVLQLSFENEQLKVTKACSLRDNISIINCRLDYIDDKPPPKIPGVCGYEECVQKPEIEWELILYIVSGVIGFGLIVASISVCCYLSYRRKHEWSTAPLGDVRIKIEEIKPMQMEFGELTVAIGQKHKTPESFKQVIYLDPNRMVSVLGTYRSTPVIVHPFKVSNRTQSVDKVVSKLRALNLENVAQIHGYVVQTNPPVHGLVIEYGEHGVLRRLLELDELDLALKLPLLADLCRALEHIHKSSLKHHGNLTSLCCVVDSHFVLKVQLNEFPTLKKLGSDSEINSIDQIGEFDPDFLWSAPEIIRKQPNVNLASADIYSFGIIAHEVIYQLGPFYVSVKDLSTVHSPDVDGPLPKTPLEIAMLIIKILRNKSRRQIRPSLPSRPGEEAVMLILKEMIKSCWEDTPTQRPSLNKINHWIRKVMRDVGIVNVFGNMVERLEFYSKHLQDAVQMKADKVDEERRRIRRVLEQLFPGISKELINGEKPKPVQYNNVCVYYNDLVGFTKICSVNKPATVVKFLNTLFLKYDSIIEMYYIHPVTRIGDAYMLVSGIPVSLTEKDHASEIAQAALQLVEAVRSTVFDYVEQYKTMQIRTGIASGRAAAGVVGTEIPSYGICGDAVVVASKMESNSEAMKILVANSSYLLLKDAFDFEPTTKEVQIGNSTVVAHWLKGKKNVSKIVLNARLDGKSKPDRRIDDGTSAYATHY